MGYDQAVFESMKWISKDDMKWFASYASKQRLRKEQMTEIPRFVSR